MDSVSKSICEELKLHLTQEVWNESAHQLRTNVLLEKVSGRSCSGHFFYREINFSLPESSKRYYIFITDDYAFSANINIENDKWVSFKDLCNEKRTLLLPYSEKGKVFSLGSSHIFYSSMFGIFIFAFEKQNADAIIDVHNRDKEVYITRYTDSNVEGEMKVFSERVPSSDNSFIERNKIKKLIEDNDSTFVFVNGYKKHIVSEQELEVGDYVDIVCDSDVKIKKTIDLSKTENKNVYFSERDKIYRLILHLDKDSNPKKKIITHDTVEFFVKDNNSNRSLYVHRFQLDKKGISQITHQDFSIPERIVNDFRDYLSSQDVSVEIYVRLHNGDNVLQKEKSRIAMLYDLPDEKIVNCLAGREQNMPEVWKAKNLEEATYVKNFFDIPNGVNEGIMYSLIDSLGFYETLSLICKRVKFVEITSLTKNFFSIIKPLFFRDKRVFPVVYLNGRKVRSSKVLHQNNHEKLLISFSDDIYIKEGDIVAIEMFLDSELRIQDFEEAFMFKPTTENLNMVLPHNDFSVYLKRDERPLKARGVVEESFDSFELLDDLVGKVVVKKREDGKYNYHFSQMLVEEHFLFLSNKSIYYREIPLDSELTDGKPIYHTLYSTSENIGNYPVLNVDTCQVFFNGKKLVKDLDFRLIDVKIGENSSFKQVVVQNLSYLKDSENFLEIFGVKSSREDFYKGFVVDDIAQNSDPSIFYLDGISSLFIDGYREDDLNLYDSLIYLPDGKWRNGLPYALVSLIPDSVKKVVSKYHKNDDREIIESIKDYLYGKYRPTDKPYIMIDESHRIYSLKIACVVYDILRGINPGIAYDSDEDRMINQIKNYEYLDPFDVAHSGIDLSFVDVYPSYFNYTAISVPMRKAIKALCDAVIKRDNVIEEGTLR